MPRKKKSSYGVKRKYKKVRYNSASEDVLNDAFRIDSSLDETCSSLDNSQFEKAFCVETVSDQSTEVNDFDLQVKASEDSDCFIGNFDVLTRYQSLKLQLHHLPQPFLLNVHTDLIEIVALFNFADKVYTKLRICVNKSGKAVVWAHGKQVEQDHWIWDLVPRLFLTRADVLKLLDLLSRLNVCQGNPDEEFVTLVPVGAGITNAQDSCFIAYREENYNAVQGETHYSSTIRSTTCSLIVKGVRCEKCTNYRRALNQRKERQKKLLSKDIDFTKSKYKNRDLPRSLLLKKLGQQKKQIVSLQLEVDKLNRHLKKKISTEGIRLGDIQNLELKDLMQSCEKEVVKSYPDSTSYQRLFWAQQIKNLECSKLGIRWHPMIIRWCLAIRQQSQKAYDTMRESGFITLPSNRTLFDYSHYISSDLGFKDDVLKMLINETEKLKMFEEEWRKYIGILFDEIRIKEDLVYDKESGELIGYCNLDSIGNSIMNLEQLITGQESTVAKYVLVLMVRGVATSLKFPLAAFATQSIAADFLYPLVWTAVSLLEVHLKLRVLFFTCDGASANRKFFNIHRLPGVENVHFTVNPFDKKRKIFFISDVPHLLKTARNCFSNSFSHKNTRRLWKNGKDISWMHIVRLFEEYCEFNLYNPCPKLSRNHIDLNAFSCMKVNLAAQVLSDSVANALEDYYGADVSETILLIRTLNRFFDILNVRSLQEGRNKRNSDLNPFRSTDDQRLTWLNEDFLGYFGTWAENVSLRQGPFTQKERSSMMLSHQTITGLKMSVLSISASVKVVLNEGADFVLTSAFNQDPLEQHFGHYRHKGGHNRNPTVNEVRHVLTNIRTVGAQALAPKRGNTEVHSELQAIDNSKLPRRH